LGTDKLIRIEQPIKLNELVDRFKK
jgi:hypothetical protein